MAGIGLAHALGQAHTAQEPSCPCGEETGVGSKSRSSCLIVEDARTLKRSPSPVWERVAAEQPGEGMPSPQ
jgi:hypothetical protein